MGEHSRFSASQTSRWMACSGSLPLSEPLPKSSSGYAAEGTAAHKLAETCLMLDIEPADFIGQEVEGFTVTDEMASAVLVFVKRVRAKLAEHADAELVLEQRIVSEEFPEFGGTIDCLIRVPSEKTLYVIDYKHGAGVAVEVDENKQLLSYALLARKDEERFILVIVQPRVQHDDGPVRAVEIDAGRVALHRRMVKAAIEKTDEATEKLMTDAADDHLELFETGEEHCRWCPALAICPKQHTEVIVEAVSDLTTPRELDIEKLTLILDRRDQLKKYLKAVEDLAKELLNIGHDVPGYKLVTAYGNRCWKHDEDEMLRKLRARKINKGDAMVTSLRSPAQIEKLPRVDKTWIATLCEKPERGLTIAHESDKRPAFIPLTADVFDTVEPTTEPVAAAAGDEPDLSFPE